MFPTLTEAAAGIKLPNCPPGDQSFDVGGCLDFSSCPMVCMVFHCLSIAFHSLFVVHGPDGLHAFPLFVVSFLWFLCRSWLMIHESWLKAHRLFEVHDSCLMARGFSFMVPHHDLACPQN